MKQRLDTLLVDLNLCESRQQAQRLIRAGEVLVNRQVIDKPGTEINTEAEIQVKQRAPFVSRGGEKLAKALAEFKIDVRDRICLDGGISTGGFTDCLLKAGAKQVYGVDVGYGQCDWGIRNDPRVILFERTNLRYLTPSQLYSELTVETDTPSEQYADFAVVDVSFISLTKILPPLWQLLKPNREVVLLVKPQFEVGKERVGKKGVVRDFQDQAHAIFQVGCAALTLGWQYRGLTWSPIQGPAGNIEYLLWLHSEGQPLPSEIAIAQITQLAQTILASSSA
ncbi:TlyA family RNA methyltransferase [Planktothrix mougeotii]|uniref:TlyA family RNA methyltransferase n=1 Tax=Planktothrix mougeotii LEGE 06226 TaxID=1828728 RepID=A0ABR9U6U2_9CYAN|nr:TlyA family RNA methyltransferase [Planktothrix mougeotii]MBE9142177.1 TlyA family RNA methyltransferase [Planktothrix mougeotii LEGE 06226]